MPLKKQKRRQIIINLINRGHFKKRNVSNSLKQLGISEKGGIAILNRLERNGYIYFKRVDNKKYFELTNKGFEYYNKLNEGVNTIWN